MYRSKNLNIPKKERTPLSRGFAHHVPAYPAANSLPSVPVQRKQKEGKAPVQLYTEIDISKKQKWEDVKHAFPSFRPEIMLDGSEEENNQRYTMKFVDGNPGTSLLNVSQNARLAINADSGSFQSAFFMAGDMLGPTNQKLQNVKSDFLLEPSGPSITVHNHPNEKDRQQLIQVTAKHIDGPKAADVLQTRCDLFYRNITKQIEKAIDIVETTEEESLDKKISHERKLMIDKKLSEVELEIGDAFEILPTGSYRDDNEGWTMHYAGIVAMDSPDMVTLENFNRNPEFREGIDKLFIKEFGMTQIKYTQSLSKRISEIKSIIGWDIEEEEQNLKDDKISLDELTKLRQERDGLGIKMKKISERATNSGIEQKGSHHFKMYGPALKEQSFLDQWRGQMDKNQSKFSVKKAKREE